MTEISPKQARELTRKLLQSTDADEILEISQKLGMNFDRQSANEFAKEALEIAALDDPQEN